MTASRVPVFNRVTGKLKEIPQHKASYLFMLPFSVIFFAFTVLPVIIAIYYSFTQFNVLQPAIYVGAKNYLDLFFNDPIFLIAFKNTLIFAVVTGPVGYLLCFLVAWFINELPPKLRSLVTLLFYAPSLAAGSAFAIWNIFFSSDQYGIFNSILLSLGLTSSSIQWFIDPTYIQGAVMTVVLWSSLGAGFLAFIAGFQNVDRSLYEAAAVDGIKNRYQELWFITLPAMRGQLMFSAIMSITGSFGIGSVITQLCGFPSSNYAAHTVMNHLEDYGTIRYQMGYACAIATVLFLVIIGLNKLIQYMISKVGS